MTRPVMDGKRLWLPGLVLFFTCGLPSGYFPARAEGPVDSASLSVQSEIDKVTDGEANPSRGAAGSTGTPLPLSTADIAIAAPVQGEESAQGSADSIETGKEGTPPRDLLQESMPGTDVSVPEEEGYRLTLKDALLLALRENLDIRAELYNPAIAEADIGKNKGIYDPRATLSAEYIDSTTRVTNSLIAGVSDGSEKPYEQQTARINPGISQLLPTGGTVGIIFNNEWYHNSSDRNAFSGEGILNNYWNSDLTLSVTQPLLKNFGRETTNANIDISVIRKSGSVAHVKSTILTTVARTKIEYFNLVALREALMARKVSLDLAKKVLVETKARVNAGVLPAMEILNAEFGVAAREKDLIDAQRAVDDQADLMRLLLQLPGDGPIIPVDSPTREPLQIETSKAIAKALAQRPDILEAKATLEQNRLAASVANNRTRPELNLKASAGMSGLDENYNRDLERLSSGDYPIYSVGVEFAYPLGNRQAKNDAIRSRLVTDQSEIRLRSLQSSIANEVKSAVRGITANYQQIQAADRRRAFAEERLRAFIKRSQVGLSTIKDVLEVEADLSTSMSDQSRAVAEYNKSVTEYYRATGDLLEMEGIVFTGEESDRLYQALQ
jgi:outer membrane protein TolC